ncbi:carotenoid oxygenase [Amniculicola lignicola CBS 123094]|uniref:Carotenoid oxygenase n=1 Tax=Amniculicola lignicola CBS 123094 TaxID=1392246 RepID=A0A6A5X3W3_9PLEO|nr:carotenoid oxygenase [Amniculicola lignicola CBS 123094]
MFHVGRKGKRGHDHPYLTGNFAPVTKAHTPTPCTFTGIVPPELLGGQYVRNGGNPVSNSDLGRDAHWFDGDGMLTGVLFQRSATNPDQTIPQFVNQLIMTDLCISALETPLLQTPIVPSIATLVNPFAGLLYILFRILRTIFLVLLSHLPGRQHAIKRISVANTSILFHDGRALAACESGPPIRVQLPGLETVGWFNGATTENEPKTPRSAKRGEEVFGGSGIYSFMKEWTTGHPKVDPHTGELVLFHCQFMAPYIHYSVVSPLDQSGSLPQGRRLLNAPVPGCSGGKMMHDFGVSLSHTVIMDLPLTLTPFNLMKGQPVVSYDPSKPARFGVFPRRRPDRVHWFETEGCCIFHTANTWDDRDEAHTEVAVNMLACRLTSASLVFSAGNLQPPPRQQLRKSKKRGLRSLFARRGGRGEQWDPEKQVSDTTPLLQSKKTSARTVTTHAGPPILGDDEEQCRLYYYRFSLKSSAPTITHQYALSAIPFEFPTLNPAYEMSFARYIYGCSTSNESFGAALGKATKIDVLLKMDVKTLLERSETTSPQSITGCVDYRSISQVMASQDSDDPIRAFRMPEHYFAQEARFVSRSNPVSEDDGYLLFYVFDEGQLNEDGECEERARSELWILNAKNMQDIVVKVKLPQRVPYGLHGNWFTEEQIGSQRPVETFREVPKQGKNNWGGWCRRALVKALG